MNVRRDSVPAIGGMSVAAFVLGHDLAYLATYGGALGPAMARTGHGIMWSLAVLSAALITLTLVGLALRRLRLLHRLAANQPTGFDVPPAPWRELAEGVLQLWVVVCVLSLALFIACENLERLSVGMPMPGLGLLVGALDPLSILALFGAVSLLIAVVAGLYRWRRERLEARILAARTRSWTPAVPLPRPPEHDRQATSVRVEPGAGRAPPRVALSAASI